MSTCGPWKDLELQAYTIWGATSRPGWAFGFEVARGLRSRTQKVGWGPIFQNKMQLVDFEFGQNIYCRTFMAPNLNSCFSFIACLWGKSDEGFEDSPKDQQGQQSQTLRTGMRQTSNLDVLPRWQGGRLPFSPYLVTACAILSNFTWQSYCGFFKKNQSAYCGYVQSLGPKLWQRWCSQELQHRPMHNAWWEVHLDSPVATSNARGHSTLHGPWTDTYITYCSLFSSTIYIIFRPWRFQTLSALLLFWYSVTMMAL